MQRFGHILMVGLLMVAGMTARAGTLAQFRTVYGTLEVELYDAEKPVTVNNFKKLVQSGAYQNTFFHRLVPGFVAQGGGYFSFVPNATNLFGPNWGNVGVVQSFGQITNEYSVGPRLSNTNGTIAMAKLGSGPNTATCEWFFNLGNNSANLDVQNGGFTVFGKVVRDSAGLLPLFNSLADGYGRVNMGWWYPTDYVATNLFNTLPVLYGGFVQPRYADLFYVDVTLLSVQVGLKTNERTISWNSVAGRTNVVEFTTTFPPSWKTLVSTNGNGARLTVADGANTNSFRFYRVRVLY